MPYGAQVPAQRVLRDARAQDHGFIREPAHPARQVLAGLQRRMPASASRVPGAARQMAGRAERMAAERPPILIVVRRWKACDIHAPAQACP